MTFVIPAVQKEAETQSCIPTVYSIFRSKIWESSLAVSCAVFATSDQDSVGRNLIMLPVFLFGDVYPSCTPCCCEFVPIESLSNSPESFLIAVNTTDPLAIDNENSCA